MKKILFATSNEAKVKRFKDKLLNKGIELLSLKDLDVSLTIGVEPNENRNYEIYRHYGFDKFLKQGIEVYPDGTRIKVNYYQKRIK